MKFFLISTALIASALISGCQNERRDSASIEAVFKESSQVIERDILFATETPGATHHVEAVMLYKSGENSSQFGFWLTETHYRGYDFWILERKVIDGKLVENWTAHSTETGRSQSIGDKPTTLDLEWLAKFRATDWVHEPIVKTGRKRLSWRGEKNLPIRSGNFFSLEQTIDTVSKLPERYETGDEKGLPVQLIQVNQIAKTDDLWVPVRFSIRNFQVDEVIRVNIRNTRKLKQAATDSFSDLIQSRSERHPPTNETLGASDLQIHSLSVL